MPRGDSGLLQQHLQQLVPEELFQSVTVVIRGDAKFAMLVKSAIGYDYVAVRIETEEVTECLDGTRTAGHGNVRSGHVLFQRPPGGTT